MSLIKIPWKKTFWQRVCESVAKLVCCHLVHHHLFRLAWQTVPRGLVAIRLKYQARQAKVSWFSRCSEIHTWNIPKCDKTRPQREIAHVMTNGCWMKSCRLICCLPVCLTTIPSLRIWGLILSSCPGVEKLIWRSKRETSYRLLQCRMLPMSSWSLKCGVSSLFAFDSSLHKETLNAATPGKSMEATA